LFFNRRWSILLNATARLDVKLALEIAKQVAAGLAAVHKQKAGSPGHQTKQHLFPEAFGPYGAYDGFGPLSFVKVKTERNRLITKAN